MNTLLLALALLFGQQPLNPSIPFATPANPGTPATVSQSSFVTVVATCDNGDVVAIHKNDAVNPGATLSFSFTSVDPIVAASVAPIQINDAAVQIVQWPHGDSSELLVSDHCTYAGGGANFTFTLTETSVLKTDSGNYWITQDNYTFAVVVGGKTVYSCSGFLIFSGGVWNHAILSK